MPKAKSGSLGQVLKAGRAAAELTLREVERQTGISNGYLSLLENDAIKNPSPRHLFQLAETYRLPYADLMGLVGYAVTESPENTLPGSAAFADLTDDERHQVTTFVRYLRESRRERK
jgi:HTH-type transcriptional regulator, competence development regulator